MERCIRTDSTRWLRRPPFRGVDTCATFEHLMDAAAQPGPSLGRATSAARFFERVQQCGFFVRGEDIDEVILYSGVRSRRSVGEDTIVRECQPKLSQVNSARFPGRR